MVRCGKYGLLLFGAVVVLTGRLTAQAGDTESGSAAELRAEIRQLQRQMLEQREAFERRIRQLEERLDSLAGSAAPGPAAPAADLAAALDSARSDSGRTPISGTGGERLEAALQNLNPDVSVIIDSFYHRDSSKEGIQHVFGEIAGFGHSHGDDHAHGHDHSHLEDGFNLRHLELHLSADVDPYFRGWAIGAISAEGAELEEAVIQTSSLPWGLQVQGGKFFSNFSRVNAQHAHEWDFVDAPLAQQLLFGDHGLNEKGVQLSWLAPTPFQLLLGVEVFQGENELAFEHHGDGPLSDESGPRLWVGWLKLAPNLPEPHGLQLGFAGGRGVHQEEHDALDNAEWSDNGVVARNPDGKADHWLDGHTTFLSTDVVYKYDDTRPYGVGDWTVESGYLWRRKDLELVDHLLAAAPVGEDRIDTQDGYYAQATYGFAARWRAGLRWEQVGLTNESRLPDGGRQRFGDSRRASAMVDFTPSEFSRLRLQVGRGDYETDDGREDVWQVYLQWTVSLGAHGAHDF